MSPTWPRTSEARPGASTRAKSRNDGVDWAYVINTRDWPPGGDPKLLEKLNSDIDALIGSASLQ